MRTISLADAKEAGKGFAPHRVRDGRVVAMLSNVTMRNQAGHAGPPSPTIHIGEETERESKIMTEQKPTVVLVHGACLVITEAAAGNESVVGLVDVNAFTPEHGESALERSSSFPGSTLGDVLIAYPVSTGGEELVIKQEMFHHQFTADVPAAQAALMAATQRPVTAAARAEGYPQTRRTGGRSHHGSWLATRTPTSRSRHIASRPNVPVSGHQRSRRRSHAPSVSNPDVVAASILDAAESASR